MTSIQQNERQHGESPHTTQDFIVRFWGVRYQVKDVRAITFYTGPSSSVEMTGSAAEADFFSSFTAGMNACSTP
jgi:hypothetical protein